MGLAIRCCVQIGAAGKPAEAVGNAVALSGLWGAAVFLTEFGGGGSPTGGDEGAAAAAQGVGWTEYQYNGYCNVPCALGENTCRDSSGSNCTAGMPCAFGACIT